MNRVISRNSLPPGTRLAKGIVRRVWRFSHAYHRQLIVYLLSVAATAGLTVVPALLVRSLIDQAIPQRNMHLVDMIAIIAVTVALANAGFTLMQRWLSAKVGEGIIYDLRTALFDHVQRQPVSFFTHAQTGALMSRMNNDVVGAQQALTTTLGAVASNIISLVVTLGVLLALDWRLTLLALALVPLFLLPARRIGRRLQVITRESMGLNASMNTTANEHFNIGGAMLSALFGRPEEEVARFSVRAGHVRDIGVRSALYGRFFLVVLGLVSALGSAAVYWVGARLVLSHQIQLGTVIAFAALLTQVYQPLTALSGARVNLMTAFISFERVFEVLDYPAAITDAPDAVPLIDAEGMVEFDHVGFHYPSPEQSALPSLIEHAGAVEHVPEEVLRDVSLRIAPGEMVALVGPSGAGKTTIAMLLARLHDPTSGAVRLDGHDLRSLTLKSIRRTVGLVTQDPHLFHDTILANLRYAAPNASMDDIAQACARARIETLITHLPDGYRTVVGERGYRLSGGEKQRLALARLLLANPRVVVLDEATAHLDSETEADVQAALVNALVGRTSLVIAHRLSTIVRADRILVLQHGAIVEEGRHDELLARGGLYAELYLTQYGSSSPGAEPGVKGEASPRAAESAPARGR